MAATATAQSFDPQTARATLRQNKRAGQFSQPVLREIPDIAPANNNDAFTAPSNNNNAFQNTLPQEQQFAQNERQYRIQNATRRDILPEYQGDDETEAEEEIIEQERNIVAQESRGRDIGELGPTRALRQQLADQAAQLLADKAQEKAKELAARLVAQGVDEVGGAIAETAEASVAEVDAGFFSWTDIAWDYARLAVTILIPEPTDVGTTGREGATYVANKAIRTVVPPYKFIFGGASIIDIADDAMAVFKLGIVSVIIILAFTFAIVVLGFLAYGVYYITGFGT
jgi:hypothetical protein